MRRAEKMYPLNFLAIFFAIAQNFEVKFYTFITTLGDTFRRTLYILESLQDSVEVWHTQSAIGHFNINCLLTSEK